MTGRLNNKRNNLLLSGAVALLLVGLVFWWGLQVPDSEVVSEKSSPRIPVKVIISDRVSPDLSRDQYSGKTAVHSTLG